MSLEFCLISLFSAELLVLKDLLSDDHLLIEFLPLGFEHSLFLLLLSLLVFLCSFGGLVQFFIDSLCVAHPVCQILLEDILAHMQLCLGLLEHAADLFLPLLLSAHLVLQHNLPLPAFLIVFELHELHPLRIKQS